MHHSSHDSRLLFNRLRVTDSQVNAATAAVASILCAFALPYLSNTMGVPDTWMRKCTRNPHHTSIFRDVMGDCLSTVVAGDLAFATGALALAIWPTASTVWYFLPICGIGIAILRTTPAALASARAGATVQGGAMGLLDAVSSCCRVVAPLVAGVLIDSYGAGAAFAVEAALAVCGALLLLSEIFDGSLPRKSASSTRDKKAK